MTSDKAKQPMVDEALFLSAAKTTLDDKVDQLDPQTRARLAQIRQRAIQAAADRTSARSAKTTARWLMPVGGGVAVAAAIVVAVILGPEPALTPAQQPASMAVLEDINILTDSEEIEFYRDLEFYEWLAASEQNVS
jgi:anti-sigma-K factor RskA